MIQVGSGLDKHFSIHHRLATSFAVLLLFFAGLGFFSIIKIHDVIEHARTLDLQNVHIISLANTRNTFWEQRYLLPNYLLSNERRAELRRKDLQWQESVDTNMNNYFLSFGSNERTETTDALIKSWKMNYEEYQKTHLQYFNLVDSGKTNEANRFQLQYVNPPARRALEAMAVLVAMERQESTNDSKALLLYSEKAKTLLLILSFIGLAIGVVLSVFVVKRFREHLFLLSQQQTKMAASAKMAALGEMAATIAHEVNNPLAIILGKSSLLIKKIEEGKCTNEEIIPTMQRIADLSQLISKIIISLRSISRDASKDPFVSVSTTDLVNNSVALCSEKFQKRGIELKLTLAPNDIYVEGRETELFQVLVNLLNNAYDAVLSHLASWIEISVVDRGDKVELSVTDSGAGIPEEIREKIFQPLFTTKPFGVGTGLGLSISQEIIKKNRGTLFLDTQSPNTKFVISLSKACNS